MASHPDSNALYESHLTSLELARRGKVRDIYSIDDQHLLIVATDRISAFDVVLADPIPGKGAVLTTVSGFWFDRTRHLTPNHLVDLDIEDVLKSSDEIRQMSGRATVVRRLAPLPIEAIVRGYLIGSSWRDYQREGSVCGIRLPPGLRQADRLPTPIYTPSTKAEIGDHDENIDFAATERLLGRRLAEKVRELSLRIYADAVPHAQSRGIVIADTKLEFGLDAGDRLVLIDEVLTPDSSRFWPVDQYRPGSSPPSFDKQFVRDYLEQQDWDKRPPPPRLPPDIVERTAAKYREAARRIISEDPIA